MSASSKRNGTIFCADWLTIDQSVQIDSEGIARLIFDGGSQSGQVMIQASVGDSNTVTYVEIRDTQSLNSEVPIISVQLGALSLKSGPLKSLRQPEAYPLTRHWRPRTPAMSDGLMILAGHFENFCPPFLYPIPNNSFSGDYPIFKL